MDSFSCVVTAHDEGEFLKSSVYSVMRNINDARIKKFELLICLDNADNRTKNIAKDLSQNTKNINILEFRYGDVGRVRQESLKACNYEYVSFLDGDDIWGNNWLSRLTTRASTYNDVIFHPQLTVFFDEEIRYVRKNADSTKRNFKKEILLFENLWTSSFVTPKSIMLEIPMKGGNTYDRTPYAYEDWSWFRETLIAGYKHVTVKKTVHFQRIKRESNTTRSVDLKKEPWPVDIKKLLF